MYAAFYKLDEMPFRLTPDPQFFYESRIHGRALAYLKYGLHKSEGVVVVTGDVGTGKTILVDRLLSQLDRARFAVSEVATTQLEPEELLGMIAAGFGLAGGGLAKAALLGGLAETLSGLRLNGKRPLIIVDEAQNLPFRSIEELRMLTNLKCDHGPLVQTVMVGQTPFRQLLARPDFEQLAQRVVAICHLQSLGAEETRRYIEHRLRRVGWAGDPAVDDDAFHAVFRHTNGVARRINMLFDRVLLLGFLEAMHKVGGDLVEQVAAEMKEEGIPPPPSTIVREAERR